MVGGRVPRNLARLYTVSDSLNLSKDSIISDSTTVNDPHLWIDLFEYYWIVSLEDPDNIYRPGFVWYNGIIINRPELIGSRLNGDSDNDTIREQMWNVVSTMISRIIINQYGSLQLYHQASIILKIVRQYLYQLEL